MEHFSWIKALLITLAYIVIDAQYAAYTIMIQRKKAYSAAFVGASMYSLMAFGIITFTSDVRYVPFVAIGSWLGTVYAVKKLSKV
jgi:hypothetical protein